jgi:hypothetical protein
MGAKAHRARRDSNEPEVLQALREHGWICWKIGQRGIPDLLCYLPLERGGVKWQAFEVKTKTGKLRDTQQWGHVPVLRSAQDVLEWNKQ